MTSQSRVSVTPLLELQMSENNLIEGVLKRDRLLVIVALSLVIIASWSYVLAGAGMGMSAFSMSSLEMALGLSGGEKMEMPPQASDMEQSESGKPEGIGAGMTGTMASMATPAGWTLSYAILMFFMWWIMMIAMMLPSASPMILLHAKVQRRANSKDGNTGGLMPTAAFAFGYLVTWGFFSAIATSLQWAFEQTGVLSPMMMNSTNTIFAGFILLFAGAYQLTPIKQACLKHCRGPLQFLSQHWQPGSGGAFQMGLRHGAFCLGCCWGLMAILFFGGIMNLYWIIGLAAIVLLEKLLPAGQIFGKITGGLLFLWGAVFLYQAVS